MELNVGPSTSGMSGSVHDVYDTPVFTEGGCGGHPGSAPPPPVPAPSGSAHPPSDEDLHCTKRKPVRDSKKASSKGLFGLGSCSKKLKMEPKEFKNYISPIIAQFKKYNELESIQLGQFVYYNEQMSLVLKDMEQKTQMFDA